MEHKNTAKSPYFDAKILGRSLFYSMLSLMTCAASEGLREPLGNINMVPFSVLLTIAL